MLILILTLFYKLNFFVPMFEFLNLIVEKSFIILILSDGFKWKLIFFSVEFLHESFCFFLFYSHVLRKIIRRASYAANKIMKSRPGVLSSLVPVVAESLDFFPEINKNIKEVLYFVGYCNPHFCF